MGESIKIKCSSCGAEWYCNVGWFAFMDESGFDKAVSAYSKETVQEINQSLAGKKPAYKMIFNDSWDEEEEPVFNFYYDLACCSDCRKIINVPALALRFRKKEKLYIGSCRKCGRKVRTISRADIAQFPCPACGKAALQEEEIGLWD